MSIRKLTKHLSFLLIALVTSCSKDNNSSNQSSSENREISHSTYTNSLKLKRSDGQIVPFLGADPDIIQGNDGYFYMYTSQNFVYHQDSGSLLDRCPIYKSKDMVNWEYCSSVFTNQDVDLSEFTLPNVGIWAPSIHYFYGQYYCYYSIGYPWTQTDNHEHLDGIGLATSPTPYGPWTHYGELFNSTDCGTPISIDPFAYQEDDGAIYLIWGSYHEVDIIELSIDGIEVKDKANIKTNKQKLINGPASMTDNYEGSYIFKKDGYYYYMGSKNGYDGGLQSPYNVYEGRSTSLFGPYIGVDGNEIYGAGNLVIDGDFDDPDGLRGVGHNAVIQDAVGDYWLVYHCYDPNCSIKNERTICIDKLIFEEDGSFHTTNYVGSHAPTQGPAFYL